MRFFAGLFTMGNGRRSPVLVIGNAHKSALLLGSTLTYRRDRPSGDQSWGASRSLGDASKSVSAPAPLAARSQICITPVCRSDEKATR